MSKNFFFWLVICYRKNVAKIIVNKIFLSLCFDLFVIIIIFFFVIFSLLFSIHSTTPPTHIHTIESYDFFFVFWLLGFVLNSLCWLEKVHTHIVWLLRFEKNHYYCSLFGKNSVSHSLSCLAILFYSLRVLLSKAIFLI